MSKDFERRLFPNLPGIIETFGTPFHIYDEKGIRETCEEFRFAFRNAGHFQEFYAVKALPNPEILKIIKSHGFGFDCSSIHELELASSVGAEAMDILFTSNDTTTQEFVEANAYGAIINLDDVSLIRRLSHQFPGFIFFRYNPGRRRKAGARGGGFGRHDEAKYGITHDQVVPAYREARRLGATVFGMHSMICSNERDCRFIIDTVSMLLEQCARLDRELGIRCEAIDIGGGFGIPYRPTDRPLDLKRIGIESVRLIDGFGRDHGWTPSLFTECGRYITGPHGVLVNRVINRKEIYQIHVGVEVAMPGLMRHAMYGAYHHITVLNKDGKACERRQHEVANVAGPICENCDRLATQRRLPVTRIGDIIVTHDTGAHGRAMGFNYNGRTRPQELLLKKDGTVVCIRRAETTEDLWSTLRNLPAQAYRP